MATDHVRIRITGTHALIMHNNQGVNIRLPRVQEMKAINKKRNKTEEDFDALARIEWELGLYYDAKLGPCLPSTVILAALREGAKKTKQGKLLLESVLMDESMVKMEYEGPRKVDALYADGRFVDMRPVRVQTSRVNRARPIFPLGWSAEFTLTYEAELIDEGDLVNIVKTTGRRIGLCDYRPTYGRFDVQVIGNGAGSRKGAAE